MLDCGSLPTGLLRLLILNFNVCVCLYTFLMFFLSFFFFFCFLVCSFCCLFVFFICLFAFLGDEEDTELMCGEVRAILEEMGEEKMVKNIV